MYAMLIHVRTCISAYVCGLHVYTRVLMSMLLLYIHGYVHVMMCMCVCYMDIYVLHMHVTKIGYPVHQGRDVLCLA